MHVCAILCFSSDTLMIVNVCKDFPQDLVFFFVTEQMPNPTNCRFLITEQMQQMIAHLIFEDHPLIIEQSYDKIC